MKKLLVVFAVLLLGLVQPDRSSAAATNAAEIRLTVDLRDGSHVVGTAIENHFKFHSTLLGELKLAATDIRSVERVSSNSAKLLTAGGDRLTVWFEDSSLTVKTSFGRIELPVSSIRKLTVSAPGTVSTRRPGLVALWSGEGDGKDSVGDHDAELTDINFAAGKVGQAFALNGFSSWATLPASRGLDLTNASGLTISAWIKPDDVDGFHPILEWEVTREKNAVTLWIGHLPQDRGVLSGYIGTIDGTGQRLVSPPGTLVTGQFQHVAMTYDKNTGIAKLLVNGCVVAQKTIGNITPNTSGPLFFSRRPCDQPGDWTYNKFFSGLLDEISIYNRELSTDEIRDLCTEENNGGLPPVPPVNPIPPGFRSGGFSPYPMVQ